MAMKKKGYAKGGAMKKKGYAKGGAMKKKPIAMKKGSKLRMVEKDGKKVPFFAADGVGKMRAGGAVRPKKRPAAMVKPKPRPGSAKTPPTPPTRKKGDRAGVTAKKTKRPSKKRNSETKNPRSTQHFIITIPSSLKSHILYGMYLRVTQLSPVVINILPRRSRKQTKKQGTTKH